MADAEEDQGRSHESADAHSGNADDDSDKESGDRGGDFDAVRDPESPRHQITGDGAGQAGMVEP